MDDSTGKQAGRRGGVFVKLRGVWRSHGYGRVLEVGAGGYRVYEETRISCLCVFEGTLEELAELYVDVRVSARGQTFSARRSTGVTRVRYRRLKALPRGCAEPDGRDRQDPVYNFEVFWHTFAERYALFDLRGIDWESARAAHRPQIGAATGAQQLFETFVEMLQPLGDGHVELQAPRGRFNAGGPPLVQRRLARRLGCEAEDAEVVARVHELAERSRNIVRQRYLRSRTHHAANGLFEWGRLDGATGYLAIGAMAGQSGRAHGARADQQAAAGAMDRVIQDIGALPSMVVDVRHNGGGYDGVSLRIAGRLIDRKRLAFTKAASKHEGYEGKQPIFVEPRGKWRYRGRILLLTSGLTTSAAEIFVLALLKHPRLLRIGEATQGELSDMMERHLPNGWRITLSNELYRASDGEIYEYRGVPPHVELPFLDPDDVEAGRDPMLDHLLQGGGASG